MVLVDLPGIIGVCPHFCDLIADDSLYSPTCLSDKNYIEIVRRNLKSFFSLHVSHPVT